MPSFHTHPSIEHERARKKECSKDSQQHEANHRCSPTLQCLSNIGDCRSTASNIVAAGIELPCSVQFLTRCVRLLRNYVPGDSSVELAHVDKMKGYELPELSIWMGNRRRQSREVQQLKGTRCAKEVFDGAAVPWGVAGFCGHSDCLSKVVSKGWG